MYITGLVGVLVKLIIPIFVWRSQPVKFGDVRRHPQQHLLFALALDIGLADSKASFKSLNGNNLATSCTKLVNFRPIISEFTLIKRAIFAAIRPQFDEDFHSSPWRSKTDWKIEQFLFQKSNWQSFLYIL